MGVYIKMEMPKSCGDCRFCGGIADTDCGPCAWCDVDGKARVADTRQDCPLVPIPPHGRLIDADAFLRTIRPITDYDSKAACTFETVKRLMFDRIEGAPTIIEAEEKQL